jgi:hypothetical protein
LAVPPPAIETIVAVKYSFPASVINLKMFNENNVEIHGTAEEVFKPLLCSL